MKFDDYSQSVPMAKNIVIKINDAIVGGVTDFTTSQDYKEETISEYLSSEAYAVVSSVKNYKVTLKILGNKEDYSSINTLLIDNIMYCNCSVLSDSTYTLDGDVYRKLVIGCGERRLIENG